MLPLTRNFLRSARRGALFGFDLGLHDRAMFPLHCFHVSSFNLSLAVYGLLLSPNWHLASDTLGYVYQDTPTIANIVSCPFILLLHATPSQLLPASLVV